MYVSTSYWYEHLESFFFLHPMIEWDSSTEQHSLANQGQGQGTIG